MIILWVDLWYWNLSSELPHSALSTELSYSALHTEKSYNPIMLYPTIPYYRALPTEFSHYPI